METHLKLRLMQKQLREKNKELLELTHDLNNALDEVKGFNTKLRSANYQLRERQNIIVRLLADISRIKFSGDRHAMRNLAQKVFENQKKVIVGGIAKQLFLANKIVRPDSRYRSYFHETCLLFGISRDMLSDLKLVESKLREVDIEKGKEASSEDIEPGNEFPDMLDGDFDTLFNAFSKDVDLDDAHRKFKEIKEGHIEANPSSLMDWFDPFALFYSLRSINEFIDEMNRRFSSYGYMGFLENVKFSKALATARRQAVKEKDRVLDVTGEIDCDPEFVTNKDSLIYMLRDLFYNAIDAEAGEVRIITGRPSGTQRWPFIEQWTFEDYPHFYVSFEDNGVGISEKKAARLNTYLNNESDNVALLSIKGGEKGGLGTKNLRDFLYLHKGCCHYESLPSGTRIHLYFEKLEV